MLRRALALSALLLAPAPIASAAGFYVGDMGARATARGGAFVANPDSVFAIHYNPAGLSTLKGLHVTGNLSLVDFTYNFQRSCPCVDPSNPDAATLDAELTRNFAARTSRNQRKAQDIPFIGAAYGFDFMNLTVGFALYGPQGPRRFTFRTPDGPGNQRYSAINVENSEAYYSLGVSIEPIKGLRLGGAAQMYQFSTIQEQNLWANTRFSRTPEDPEFDVSTRLEFRQGVRPNWVLGLSYDLPFSLADGTLTFGGSVLGKRSVRADGTATFTLPDSLQTLANVTGSEIELEINLPPIWRAGLQWEKKGLAKVEFATLIEAWQVNRAAIVRGRDVQIEVSGMGAPLGEIRIPYEFDTTVAFKLGGEFNLWEPYVGLRAGYFFEKSAVPEARKDASTPDLDKHGISFGLGTEWYGVRLEVGVQYIQLITLESTNSEQRLVGPIEPPSGSSEFLTIIGNGTYSGSYLIGGATLSFSLDGIMGAFGSDEEAPKAAAESNPG